MRRSTAAAGSVVWFVAIGGTFGCLLPYLLNDWHFHRPLPYWVVAQAAGVVLIGVGLVPVVQSFIEFTRADGTPIPVASPPRLVVSGFYRYVRNPIYVGFLAIMMGQVLLFGSLGLLVYTRWPGASGRPRRAGMRSRFWPASSAPTIRLTGARYAPGCPGGTRGRPALPERPATVLALGDRASSRGGC